MKIVTIGGGTGTPIVNEALLRAGANYIHSIVTVMDSGGITGRMRTDSKGEEVAYTDGLRCLLSLIDPKALTSKKVVALKEFLSKRNDRGQDLGYTIFSHYYNFQNGFLDTQNLLETLTDIKFKGQIIPSTLRSTHIDFSTASGFTFHGEHELDDKRMSEDSVSDIWLDPSTSACPDALKAISQANFIFFSCGSLYGSILANLRPRGIKQALKRSKAKKVLVTNLASTRNSTNNFTPSDFIKVFQKYSGLKKPLDIIVIPNISRDRFEKKYPKIKNQYAVEHSHFLGWDTQVLKETEKQGVKFYTHDATIIDPVRKRIRHDPRRLSKSLKSIIQKPLK